jgi:kynurenine formamidase
LLDRGVVALGVDTASIDFGASKDFLVHRMANAANVIGLENVARLEELPPTGAWTIALPIKIENGSGGPARILGLVPRTDAPAAPRPSP